MADLRNDRSSRFRTDEKRSGLDKLRKGRDSGRECAAFGNRRRHYKKRVHRHVGARTRYKPHAALGFGHLHAAYRRLFGAGQGCRNIHDSECLGTAFRSGAAVRLVSRESRSTPQDVSWTYAAQNIGRYFDIEAQSAELKNSPEKFEQMRNGYHYREEFF